MVNSNSYDIETSIAVYDLFQMLRSSILNGQPDFNESIVTFLPFTFLFIKNTHR
jgi:hypothetical protein